MHALLTKAYPDEHREQLVTEVHKAHIPEHGVQTEPSRKYPLKHFVQTVLLEQVLQPNEQKGLQAVPLK
jgi:hypothetical protein